MLENQPITTTAENIRVQPGVTQSNLSRRSQLERILFLAPAVFFQLAWGWYPVLIAFYLSFTNSKLMRPPDFVAFENYRRLLFDPLVGKAFQITFTYAALSIVLTFIVPILVAILLMEMPSKVMRFMMLLWFLPLSGVASTILWRYMYNSKYGLFQYFFNAIGMSQLFLNDPQKVLFWLILPGLLLFGPGLIYMASLQSIPASYYEAAEIEGAGFWRKIWTITLPRLRPVIAMMLTFAIIGSLQEFTWPQIMTGPNGDPGGAARTVVMYIYQPLWSGLRLGDATALAVMLFFVILIITIIYRTLFKEDPDV